MRTIRPPKTKPINPQSPTISPILSPTPHTTIGITTTHTHTHIYPTLAPTHTRVLSPYPTLTHGRDTLYHTIRPRTGCPSVPTILVSKCAGIHARPRGGVCPGTGVPILSIHIVAMSILSISITQARFICYIKGDKVMCYIERKSPRPRSLRTARHTNRTPVRVSPYKLMCGIRLVYS